MGVNFDSAHRVGEPRGHLGETWASNIWGLHNQALGTEEGSAHALLPSCIDQLLRRTAPISAGLAQVVDELGGQFAIQVTSSSVPGISLSSEQVRQIADLGLSLDIDIILVG